MRHSLLVIFLFLFCQGIEATQFLETDTTQLLRCNLSFRHHNRIAFNGKRIKKFIYPEGSIVLRQEEESGQIFVQSLIDYPPVTTISIVSDDGFVQDLELYFEDSPSEIVILEEGKCFSCPIEEISCIPINDFEILIKGALCGRLPEGTISFECDRKAKTIKKGVLVRRISMLIGGETTAFLLSIENHSKSNKSIQECDLSFMGGDWIYIQKNHLKPGEKGLAMVGKRSE